MVMTKKKEMKKIVINHIKYIIMMITTQKENFDGIKNIIKRSMDPYFYTHNFSHSLMLYGKKYFTE